MTVDDKNVFEFPGGYPDQSVRLTFAPSEFADPNCVLVFAFWNGQLLFTRHKTRGWEVPGGTREPGEWPIQTAIRETYEETGAEIAALEPLGQYRITTSEPSDPPFVKTIYVAKIAQMHPLPEGFETEAIRFFDRPPTPAEVKSNAEYSPVVQDDVYRLCLERLQGHRFWR